MKKIHIWDFWDWNSIRKTALILGGFVIVCFFLLNKGHYLLKLSQKNMAGRTTGEIYQRNIKESLVQGRTGNRQSIDGLTILYSYTVNGKKYYHFQTLTYSLIDAPQLNSIYQNQLPVKIKVKYDLSNPYLSAIDLN